MIKAEIIADSLNEFGNRITTFVITFPRIILAEFNTHRMFSRNSASSRAIPFPKMVEAVQKNPFIPLKWMMDHKGMQGNQYFDQVRSDMCEHEWLKTRDMVIDQAEILNKGIGLTKQMANRLLEPWMYHTAIVTATEYENFFALRAEGGAEIHIQKLAEEMLYAMNESQPRQLRAGEWHIPYGDQIDETELSKVLPEFPPPDAVYKWRAAMDQAILKVATARCAQVSYTVIGEDGKAMDYAKLIALHDRLAKAGHWSPFEHCARSMRKSEFMNNFTRRTVGESDVTKRMLMEDDAGTGALVYSSSDPETAKPLWYQEYGWLGNFRGFIQYRKMFENENRSDSRLIKA